MADIRQKYISLIQNRSEENKKALTLLFSQGLFGNCVSILRQELDSFIRVMYLGRISDFDERERMMNQTLSGEKWTVLTSNNKWKQITDKDMVGKANEFYGYIQYVYKFGCASIHLSDFHNYTAQNPFEKLNDTEKYDIKNYLNTYHNYPIEKELTVENISDYIPNVFEKISSNLTCYFGSILNNGMIEMY
ncbi:hypothetical protein EVD20_01215 [Elizabethkingia bruuniana]|nr:hypothetical protein EVD20_01215 [Elizabethkingia bruuniana]